MLSSKNTKVLFVFVSLGAFYFLFLSGLVMQSCGSKDACEKAREIQKRICVESESEQCFPCPCILRGETVELASNEFGLPDLRRSSCANPIDEPCEGSYLQWSQECIEDEQTCDPRYFEGIKLFDDGNGMPGFEEACGGHW